MIQLQLTIPEPCHQDWNEMTPNEKGRFCNSCAKTVVDFTAMTDAQLLRYFAEFKGKNICGNMHSDQLQRTISSVPAPRKKLFRYWQYAAASLLLFLKMPTAKAQRGFVSSKITITDTSRNAALKKVAPVSLLKRIAVTDIDAQPIAGANVQFLRDKHMLITDRAGIIFLNKINENDNLLITAVGYEDKTITVKDIESGTVKMDFDIKSLENIVVQSNSSVVRGSVVTGMLVCSVSGINFAKDSVAKIVNLISPVLTAYPNPVPAGSRLNLSLKIKQPGMCRFYIYDASGKLMMAQNHQVRDKIFTQSLNIPAGWSKGMYFVTITGEDGKNIGKTKIVVQ